MFDRQRDLFNETPSKEITWREKYDAVIHSKRWGRIRNRFIDKHDKRCTRCGWQKLDWDKSRKLELHHKTYERLGAERDDDLDLVCSVCHDKADRERSSEARKRASQKLHDAQFDGWATKVYGEDYFMFEDEFMHERFCEWKDRKSMEDQ